MLLPDLSNIGLDNVRYLLDMEDLSCCIERAYCIGRAYSSAVTNHHHPQSSTDFEFPPCHVTDGKEELLRIPYLSSTCWHALYGVLIVVRQKPNSAHVLITHLLLLIARTQPHPALVPRSASSASPEVVVSQCPQDNTIHLHDAKHAQSETAFKSIYQWQSCQAILAACKWSQIFLIDANIESPQDPLLCSFIDTYGKDCVMMPKESSMSRHQESSGEPMTRSRERDRDDSEA
jgi:hypothetical protein